MQFEIGLNQADLHDNDRTFALLVAEIDQQKRKREDKNTNPNYYKNHSPRHQNHKGVREVRALPFLKGRVDVSLGHTLRVYSREKLREKERRLSLAVAAFPCHRCHHRCRPSGVRGIPSRVSLPSRVPREF